MAQTPHIERTILQVGGLAGAMFHESGDGLLVVDPATERILDANGKACELSGFARKELLEQLIHGVIKHEQGWQGWKAPLSQAMAFPAREGFLLRTSTEGRWVPVNVSISHLYPPGLDPVALFSLRDRTEQVQAHRLAQHAEAELRRVLDISERRGGNAGREEQRLHERQRLEGLATVVGKVAHDFNNLITGLLGQVALAHLEPGHAPGPMDQVESLALRAAVLCRQLESLAGQPTSGAMPMSLACCLEQAAASRREGLRPGVTVRVETSSDSRLAQADPARVAEALICLLDNALAAMGDGPGEVVLRLLKEEPPEPTLSYAEGAPLAWLEVRDSGPGLSPEAQVRLFEPYFTTREGGHGLGLPSVLAIVRSHRGAVQVESTAGSGTAVRLGFPLTPRTIPPPPPSPRSSGQATVLLADDEESVLDVVSRLLASLGYKVLAARNGEEVLQLHTARGAEIHLAILDLTMPKMCGDEAAKCLRKASPYLPVVLMSGYPEAEVLPRIASVSGVTYLQKPFRLPALIDLLKKVMPE